MRRRERGRERLGYNGSERERRWGIMGEREVVYYGGVTEGERGWGIIGERDRLAYMEERNRARELGEQGKEVWLMGK